MTSLQAGSMRGVILLLTFLLGGCQAPLVRLENLAAANSRQVQVLPGLPFPLVLVAPQQAIAGQRLRVYLEGDGHAWVTPNQPSLDPSPRHLLMAGLAFADLTPNLYLARPCQFVRVPACHTALWTNQRYGEKIVQSLDQALDQIKSRYGNHGFELIGYSGGATLALLLATRRDDVALVQTLAGNLSPRRWAALQQLTPLDGSLEPLDLRKQLANVPQRHLLGDADRVIPQALLDDYLAALGSAKCLEAAILPRVSHVVGWPEAWAAWSDRQVHCSPRSARR